MLHELTYFIYSSIRMIIFFPFFNNLGGQVDNFLGGRVILIVFFDCNQPFSNKKIISYLIYNEYEM